MSAVGVKEQTDPGEAARSYSLVATPPQAFGKYSVIGKLGHGGMADVNLAVSEGKGGFRKLVVIKRLHPHLAMEPGFVDMFLDEARLAARLNHPHCVQTYEVGEWDDHHFLAMEYLDGQGLERLLRISGQQDRPVPVELCARIVSDALDGLVYAHELTDFDGTPLTVVHRDVSPQNIFITYNGVVKLLDFGIAKAATHVVETKTGVIKGKYAYIAPEQALGQQVDQRSDIWSMGVVLWEVLTGRRLFKSINELATLHETLQGEIKLPSAFRPDLPTELDTICMRALTREPEERYASAQDMKDDLDRFLMSLPKAPGRKHISRLMRDRFEEVIAVHKATLADCLRGTGAQLSARSLQKLVDPSVDSASGIRSHESSVTPTPTPTPGVAGAPIAPPSVTPSPPPREGGNFVIKALLLILVILLAIIAALLLPLAGGEDEGSPSTSELGAGATLAGATERPVPTEAQRIDPGAAATDPRLGARAPAGADPSTAALDGAEEASVQGSSAQGSSAQGSSAQGSSAQGSSAAEGSEEEEATGDDARARRARAERRARRARQRREPEPSPVEEPRPPAAEPGRLFLVTSPWTHASWNGRDLGTTPLMNVEMPPGTHTLRLVNREAGVDQTHRVTIRAGERTAVRVGLR